jgi:hypothetical protein
LGKFTFVIKQLGLNQSFRVLASRQE